MTPQRLAILDLINSSSRHWDAEELARALAEQGRRIGIATVYRGLAALEAEGLIASVRLAERKRYERADKTHHDHMICSECGAIQEFSQPQIERLQQAVADTNDFRMTGHQLVMFGLCARCRKGADAA